MFEETSVATVAPASAQAAGRVPGGVVALLSPPATPRRELADVLEEAEPGPELAALLAGLEPADVPDAALVEAIAAWDRLASWTAARQARIVSELQRRRDAQHCGAYVSDEIAARLACTRHVAEMTLGLALGLERLPAVASALDVGHIDARKATLITENLLHVPGPAAQDAANAVLPDAPTMTPPQLRARLRRIEIARDPEGADERHRRAAKERYVDLSPTSDAMAWLTAYLPADDAVGVYTTLTAIADVAAPDDPRPIGARRADALVDLATRWLDAGVCPDGALPRRQGRRPHLSVTASASTLVGLDAAPGELAGYGPIPAPMARRIAARSTWTPLIVEARTGEPLARGTRRYQPTDGLRSAVIERDVTCVFPGCRQPSERCDVDHVSPFVHDDRTATQTGTGNLQSLCRHHHRAKTHGAWAVTRDEHGVARWRSPAGLEHERPPATTPPPGFLVDLPPGTHIDIARPDPDGGPPRRGVIRGPGRRRRARPRPPVRIDPGDPPF